MPGGVTAARGFLASGVKAGIKKHKKDLALIYSECSAAVAGTFTTNRVKAAPLLVTMSRVASGTARAVVANSGNANACTGREGYRDALLMAREAARAMNVPEEQVLVASTGLIGERLPLERIVAALPEAVRRLSREGHGDAAEAIMTTDTVPKEAAVAVEIGGRRVTVGGMAKGAGMIHPRMATMLAFLTTDAALTPEALGAALRRAVDETFNMITVDGDTSTNDMVLLLANGRAENPLIVREGPELAAFTAGLVAVCGKLARAIARDGEGATRLIEVEVRGAASVDDARAVARAVAGSSLVKAAVHGGDANWGRIMCAAGYSGAEFDPECVDIFLGCERVVCDGRGVPHDGERVREALLAPTVRIVLDLKAGEGKATAWGCDLSA
ncbi:MAG: bifunctional glutamate N-acetyltransferase/amino-acid acetyltransferase ArgJ, partial [Firmicutes bacterium]|nr:bifunctional glutamate N-acetyltransferase/amino-acid acetyltransferase ArgJ [Bacillota bacterium]